MNFQRRLATKNSKGLALEINDNQLAGLAIAALLLLSFLGAPPANAQAEAVEATISLGTTPGTNPWGVAVDPTTNRVYVTKEGGSSVAVIDGTPSSATVNTVLATITVGSTPRGLGVDPGTHRVYVANSATVTVSVIDGTLGSPTVNTVLATISLPGSSTTHGVVVNPTTHKVYVTRPGSDTVSVVDGTPGSPTANTQIASIAVGDLPQEIAFNPFTNMLYVANRNSNDISVIDVTSNSVVATISLGAAGFNTFGVGVNPTTNRVYAGNSATGTLSVIDGAPGSPTANTVLTVISVGSGSLPTVRGVAANPVTNRVYVTSGTSTDSKVSVIDGTPGSSTVNTVISTISAGNTPRGIAFNPATNKIYVANQVSIDATVISVSPTGKPACLVIGQSTFTANTPATTQSGLRTPSRVAFDSSGSLWVADQVNHRVLKFTPPYSNGMSASLVLGQSVFTTAIFTATQSGMTGPFGITFDSSGNLWVAEFGNSRVLRFSPPFSNGMNANLVIGQPGFFSDTPATTQSGFDHTTDVAFDSVGNLWVADFFNNRILKFGPPFSSGMSASLVLGQTTFTSNAAATTQSGLSKPDGMAFDSSGNLWVADIDNNRVLKFSPPFTSGMNAALVLGQSSFTASASALSQSGLSQPSDVVFDSVGNLWVADGGNLRVLEFIPPFSNGMNAARVIGQANFVTTTPTVTQSTIDGTFGINFDSAGNLWVADSGNHRVLEFCVVEVSATTTAALTGGGASANHASTTGISVSVTGSSSPNGTPLTVFTAVLSWPSAGVSLSGLSGAVHFDVQVTGITDGTARICITHSSVTSSTVMRYWDGSAWVNAANQSVSGNTICGDIPVSALQGTNIGIGLPPQPIAAASITSPSDSSTLFTNFGLTLSATPSSGKIVKQGTVVPRATISPDSSAPIDVHVSYSNTGSAASGTLTLSDNSNIVGTLSTTDLQGAASAVFSITLGEGAHNLVATLTLSNAAGSSSSSSSITTIVSSTIASIASLSFAVSGPGTATYSGKLTYQVTSGNIIVGEGNLGDSAASFSALALPTPVSTGQSLVLQEPIKIKVTAPGTITVTVSVTANGYTQTASVSFTAEP